MWRGSVVGWGGGVALLLSLTSFVPPLLPPPQPVLSQDSLLCHCVMCVTVPYTLYRTDCMCSSGVPHLFTSPWDGEKQSTVSVFAAWCMDERDDAPPFNILSLTRSVLKFVAKLCVHRAQELCQSCVGHPALPVTDSLYGVSGRKATLN